MEVVEEYVGTFDFHSSCFDKERLTTVRSVDRGKWGVLTYLKLIIESPVETEYSRQQERRHPVKSLETLSLYWIRTESMIHINIWFRHGEQMANENEWTLVPIVSPSLSPGNFVGKWPEERKSNFQNRPTFQTMSFTDDTVQQTLHQRIRSCRRRHDHFVWSNDFALHRVIRFVLIDFFFFLPCPIESI